MAFTVTGKDTTTELVSDSRGGGGAGDVGAGCAGDFLDDVGGGNVAGLGVDEGIVAGSDQTRTV